MDPIDILGDLLGHKTSKPSRGGDILGDIFGRASSRSGGNQTTEKSSDQIRREAEELEDLLNVAKQRSDSRRSGSASQTPTNYPSPPPTRTAPPRYETRPTPPTSAPPSPRTYDSGPTRPTTASNKDERAVVLIRAMIQAAKADGQLDASEQQRIIERLGNPTRESIDFLRTEFARPSDVTELARNVPLGMEQDVYTMSLIAIDLDSGKEAKYLVELGNALRLPQDVREGIHQRLGAPSVY